MKIRRNKKGFTIVELVIVIAVIGILTAILIPTFVNLTKKANKASDQSLVTNLNTALRMAEGDNEIVDGHKLSNENVTMHDAVLDLDAYGYGLTKLVTKSSEDLLYSLKENKFYLSNDKDIDKNYSAKEKVQYLWAIQNSVTGSEKYSVYAGAKWSQTTINDLHVGFDAGVRTDISSISYSNNSQQNVVIRTKGGALNITAPNDSVSHFGKAETIKIVSIATSSYHENGEASFVEINKGRIVLESDADVNHIHVNAIEGQDAFDEVIIAKSKAVEMPALSRDNVEIDPTNGTLVVAIQDGTSEDEEKDYVWLTKEGAFEQIKVSDNPNSAGNEWISTSDKSEETKSAAQQIANNVERNVTVGDDDYIVDFDPDTREIVIKDAETQEVISNPEIIDEVKETAVEEVPDKAEIIIGATLFAGGTGTEKDPFLIEDYDTFQNVSKVFENGYFYFKVKNGVSTIDCKNWIPAYLNGSFDGNGVKLANLDATLFRMVGVEGNNTELSSWTQKDIKISNFTVDFKCEGSIDQAQGLARNIYGSNTTTFENIHATGTMISGSNGAIFFCYTSGNDCGYNPNHSWATVPTGFMQNINITDCSVATTIYAPAGSVGVIGGHYCAIPNNLRVVVNNIDTIFTGNFFNNSGKYHLMYGAAFGATSDSTVDPGEIVCPKINTATITKGSGNYTTTAVQNASYIKTYISAQLNKSGTALQGITMTLQDLPTIENVIPGSNYNVLSTFNKVDYSVRQNENSASVVNGVLSAKIGGKTEYDSGSIKLVVLQYSNTGELLASKTIIIANKANATSGWTIN